MKSQLLRLLPYLLILALTAVGVSTALAQPTSVTLVGDLQTELGCGSDWDPTCADTHLIEQGYGVWREVFTVPAGSWQYKMALNDSWDVSYPADNKLLTVGVATAVRFYYDDKTNAVVDSVNDQVPVAAGSFQDQLGCPGVWQPSCVNVQGHISVMPTRSP